MCTFCSSGVPACVLNGTCSFGFVYHLKTGLLMAAPVLGGVLATIKIPFIKLNKDKTK